MVEIIGKWIRRTRRTESRKHRTDTSPEMPSPTTQPVAPPPGTVPPTSPNVDSQRFTAPLTGIYPFRKFRDRFHLPHPARDHYTKASPQERKSIQERMNRFLSRVRTDEDYFPDSATRIYFNIGRHYHDVRADQINRMFPEDDVGLRSMLDQFRYMYKWNFAAKMLWRRAFQAIALSLLVVLSPAWLGQYWQVADLILPNDLISFHVVVGAASFLVFWGLSAALNLTTNPLLTETCVIVSHNILERLQALGNCINEISVAQRDLYDQTEEKWVGESDYLTALLVWLPMRAFHIESYFQLRMWNCRRMMGYGQWFGAFIAISIAILYCYWASIADAALFAFGEAGRIPFMVTVGIVSALSFLSGGTSMAAIRNRIPVDQWESFAKIAMHRRIAAVVAFLIKKFIMLRDVGRPTR